MNNFLTDQSDVFIGRRREISRYLVVSMQGYFPVLVRTGEADLCVVYRTGAPHMGITGTLTVSTSNDGGISWSDGRRVTPRWEDARNPAMGITASGRLILAYWTAVRHAYQQDRTGWIWKTKDPDEMGEVPGLAVRSSDAQGESWSDAEYILSQRFLSCSPYGRIVEAHDGRLIMPVYGRLRDRDGETVGAGMMISDDEGTSWADGPMIAEGYNETALAFIEPGVILAASRSQEDRNIATFKSADNGSSWTKVAEITRRSEHPADLTVLQSGRVLLTFGRRIRPFGCGALISDDRGNHWNRDREALLAGDGARNTDLGYPSTVQLADGTIVTVLYYASGSQTSDESIRSWGEVSCQALRYSEQLFSS